MKVSEAYDLLLKQLGGAKLKQNPNPCGPSHPPCNNQRCKKIRESRIMQKK